MRYFQPVEKFSVAFGLSSQSTSCTVCNSEHQSLECFIMTHCYLMCYSGSRLLTGGQLIQMWHCPEIDSSVEFFIHDDRMTSSSTEAELPQWSQLWYCKPATPVQQVTFSPDGLLFGTVGKVCHLPDHLK